MSEHDRPAPALDFEGWTCPVPLRDSPTIVMGHGGGGAMSGRADRAPVPAGVRRRAARRELGDSAVLDRRRRPAGVLDRLVRGAAAVLPRRQHRRPRGQRHGQRPGDERRHAAVPVGRVHPRGGHRRSPRSARVADGARRGRASGRRQLVTGDTKVVDAGHGDGVYINTAGIGLVPDGRRHPAATAPRPGDVVIVSGDIGVHGVAVMSVPRGAGVRHRRSRATARRCTAWSRRCSRPTPDLHVLRDPTRGGVAASLNEIARPSGVGVELDERDAADPGRWCANACALLGLDPLYVANEGKLLAFVPPDRRRRGAGRDAGAPARRRRGRDRRAASPSTPAWWSARTGFGGTRVVDLPIGEQLPRIC